MLIGSAAAAAELHVVAPSAPGTGWDQLAQAMKTVLANETPPTTVEIVNVPAGAAPWGSAEFLGETPGPGSSSSPG